MQNASDQMCSLDYELSQDVQLLWCDWLKLKHTFYVSRIVPAFAVWCLGQHVLSTNIYVDAHHEYDVLFIQADLKATANENGFFDGKEREERERRKSKKQKYYLSGYTYLDRHGEIICLNIHSFEKYINKHKTLKKY